MSGNDIQIKVKEGGEFSGYLAVPKEQKAPGMLVIQEIFGVNSHIREVTDDFASLGYLALAPDMFWRIQPNLQYGYTPEDIAKARELRGKFNLRLGMSDVQAALAALRGLPQCTGKVGVVGYCFGGFIAYLTAARTDVAAGSCYYGGGIDQYLGEAEAVKCPIQFHFGAADQSIPKESVDKVRAAFANRPNAEVFVYQGAGHGFNCDKRASYNPEAAKLARQRTLELFRKTIGPA